MDAGDRRLWQADQDTRPLSELGIRQAKRMCDELAKAPVDALYSSAALRARQTIEPLAERFSLPIADLRGLHESDSWLPPPGWRDVPSDMSGPLGGAFAAGLGMTALRQIVATYPDGRVVACSHGDVVPALIVYLMGSSGLDVPVFASTRGGWYTLTVAGANIDIELHEVLEGFPLEAL